MGAELKLIDQNDDQGLFPAEGIPVTGVSEILILGRQ